MNRIILAQGDANQAVSRIGSEPVGHNELSTHATVQTQDPNGLMPPVPTKPSPWPQMILMGALFLMMYLMLFRGPRKKQQQQQQMIASLKKNDRVRTIGGIHGTVMEVKGDEVVLKIDESNNTRIRVSTSAIGATISKDGQTTES